MTAHNKSEENQVDSKAGIFGKAREAMGSVKARAAEKFLVLCGTAFLSLPAFAQDEEFSGFREKVEDLAGGDFAIGISVLALIMGCLFGLARQSVAPAFLGLGIAGAFAVGPYLIIQIFEWFA